VPILGNSIFGVVRSVIFKNYYEVLNRYGTANESNYENVTAISGTCREQTRFRKICVSPTKQGSLKQQHDKE